MSETGGKQSRALEDKALSSLQPHSRSGGDVDDSTKSEVSYDESTPSTLPYEAQVLASSFSFTRDDIEEATQTPSTAEASDTPEPTWIVQISDPTNPQHVNRDTPTATAEKLSTVTLVFPVLQKKLNNKIQGKRLVNRKLRNNLARIEDCEKYQNTLKTMEGELEAEKKKTPELLALLRRAEQKFTASVDDWERMVREHLE